LALDPMLAFNCSKCGAQLVFSEAIPGMNAKCPQCGAIVQAPDRLIVLPPAAAASGTVETTAPASPLFGIASLMVFCTALLVGIGMTLSPSSGGVAHAFDGIAAIGVGLIITLLSTVLAAVGIARAEIPRWPAFLGFGLTILPSGAALYMLWRGIAHL